MLKEQSGIKKKKEEEKQAIEVENWYPTVIWTSSCRFDWSFSTIGSDVVKSETVPICIIKDLIYITVKTKVNN